MLGPSSYHRSHVMQPLVTLVVSSLLAVLFAAAPTHGWGIVGHEIVATIAQTQLHPDVRATLCDILPPERTAYRSAYPQGPSRPQTQ